MSPSALGWQCGVYLLLLPFVSSLGFACWSPDLTYFPTTFFSLDSQSAVPSPLTAQRCALAFWRHSCRQDWTCRFWKRATNSKFSRGVHVRLPCWLWIDYFCWFCKAAFPGCLPPFKQRWHLVKMTKKQRRAPRYKEKLTGMKQCGEARVGDLPKEK